MATAKKLWTISGGYNQSTSNWKRTRPNGFIPFHTDNATYLDASKTTKDRAGTSTTWERTNQSGDVARFNASGMWYNGNYDNTKAYRHRTDNNKDRKSVLLCGWPYGSTYQDVEAATCSPITNFAGIQFKWNTDGSHWSDSAIRIESKSAVGFVCYDWVSGKTYVQKADAMYYSGRSPITDGSNAAVSNNGCAFVLSSSDQTWIRQSRIYLVGFYIQFFQKNEGGMSRYRYFNMWDLQVHYSLQGAGSEGSRTYPYRLVMPAKQSRGIGNHGENVERRPIKLYYS